MITLTNGAQVPENAVQLRTTAPMDGYYVTQPLQLVQYDETLPVAAVQLTYQNQPYIPPTGAELNVRMGKPDGTTVYNPCLGVDSSGVVYFIFTLQMTIVAGTGTLTVEVTDSGVKNSAPIIVNVAPNPVPEGAIASTDEFLTLQEILAEAEQWGQIVQANAANIQEVVDNLTDIQNAAENAQAAAASAEAAQQAAQEALGFRTFFSAVAPDSNGNLDPSRPMVVGPAASVEIESAGDRIESVTALGFTQQAGTGDPSPENARAITNGGTDNYFVPEMLAPEVTWDAETKTLTKPSSTGIYYDIFNGTTGLNTVATNYIQLLPNTKYVFSAGACDTATEVFVVANDGTVSKVTGNLDNASIEAETGETGRITIRMYATGKSKATNLSIKKYNTEEIFDYVVSKSGINGVTFLPLTAPLCEGDSVVSWARSGCDKFETFDGSEDEVWVADSASGTGPSGSKRMYAKLSFNVPNGDGTVKSAAYFNYLVNVTNNSLFTGQQDNVGAVMQSRTVSSGAVYVRISGISTVEALREYLAAHPLTVWYRSTNYTPAADIPVSLETHQQAVLVLDGTEGWMANAGSAWCYSKSGITPGKGTDGTVVCSQFKGRANTSYIDTNWVTVSATGYVVIKSDVYTSDAEALSAYLAAQYAAGTPVTIVYQLAAPIACTHPAVVLEAATGEQLTYTVTGQSGGTVSVAIKPFQDGGHAKTADNAQQLGGLTLPALQNLLVPVGYIFSWAPVDNGPDLSTPAAVAAYFGFGTWQAYGSGQVLVGLDAGQTEFATPGKTGGEKTHTLTVPELASHRHAYAVDTSVTYTGTPGYDMFKVADSGSSNTGETGGNQPHNNLQPYVVVYRWQRIA